MTEFMKWLRVELLRLRGFDWGSGSKSCSWLKDGVAKFSSFYLISDLTKKIGIQEEEIVAAIDSPAVNHELNGKSFTLSWKEGALVLSWLEEGIGEYKTEIKQDYYAEDGKFYVKYRWITRIIYLDGTDRIVSDTGEPKPACISEEAFLAAGEQIRRSSDQQTKSPT